MMPAQNGDFLYLYFNICTALQAATARHDNKMAANKAVSVHKIHLYIHTYMKIYIQKKNF